MKKLYSTLAIIIGIATSSVAQTTLTTAVDFTVTDTHGNSHNLFTLLNSGKYVCLDFFFTTCVPCQGASPHFKTTYTNYGCNTQDIYFMSVDNGNTDAEVDQYETTYLGGNSGFPAISGSTGGGNAVVSAYGIGAFPTFILIAPNKQILEQDMWPISSPANFDTYFAAHSLTQKACATGIENKGADNNAVSFNYFPNPAGNVLNISIPDNGNKLVSYAVSDAIGKKYVAAATTNDRKEEINLEGLNPGMYFIEVVTKEGKAVKTFMKN